MAFIPFSEQNLKNNTVGFNVADRYKHLTVPELQERTKQDRLNYDICLMNLTGDLNTGNIIRSAHLLGAGKVHIFGRNKFDARSLVGAANYIDIAYYGGLNMDTMEIELNKFIVFLNEYDYDLVLVEQHKKSIALNLFKPSNRKILLIFGNEGVGIQKNIIDHCYHHGASFVEIPQYGVMRSLNVSSAAAIVMYQLSEAIK